MFKTLRKFLTLYSVFLSKRKKIATQGQIQTSNPDLLYSNFFCFPQHYHTDPPNLSTYASKLSFVTFSEIQLGLQRRSFQHHSITYYLSHCNLIQGIYYIEALGLVTNAGIDGSVYEREIGISDRVGVS